MRAKSQSIPPPPPARQVVATDETTADEAEIARMDKQREAAYDAVYEWHGQPLEPFSSGRDALYRKLAAIDFNIDTKDMIKSGYACLGDARLVIFVCSHTYEQLWPYRQDVEALLGKAYQWADQNIAHNEDAKAIELWKAILRDGRATQAVPRPSGRKTLDEGNLPRP